VAREICFVCLITNRPSSDGLRPPLASLVMRTNSVPLAAHIEADEALVRGWKAKASQTLLKALLQEPRRDDLKNRILELDALQEGGTQQFTSKASHLWNTVHFLMGFVFQFALLASILFIGLAFALSMPGDGRPEGFMKFATLISVGAGYCVLTLLVWSRLFLEIWFRYLRWVPRAQAPNASSWLAAYTTFWQFSSDYWRRKDKFYVERYNA